MAVKLPKKVNGYEILKREKSVTFPTYIFPEEIENLINMLEASSGFEKEVSAASILFTVSTILGNSIKVKVKNTWIDTPNIWVAIIGRRGTMKTPTINFGINPLKTDERNFSESFDNEMKEYNKLSKDDKHTTPRPIRRQRYSNDPTVEGLIKTMKENPNGVGIFKDELNGFFEEMNRYKSGGNLEFYLSAFSGGQYIKNRMSYDAITIDNIFLSIIGTVQPEVLKTIAASNTVNGMIDRWLFVESSNKIYEFDFTDVDIDFIEQYNSFIRSIKQMAMHEQTMEWTVEGLNSFKDAMNTIEGLMKDDDTSDQIFTYLSKMKTYLARFCVVIPVMNGRLKISKYDVELAFKLISFFIDTAFRTFLKIDNANTFEILFKDTNSKTIRQKVLTLKKEFPAVSVTEIAKIVGCSRSYASTTVNSDS